MKSEFSDDCGAWIRLTGVTIKTSMSHAHTDDLTKRFNGTLKVMLRKVVSKSRMGWDIHLSYMMMVYRDW